MGTLLYIHRMDGYAIVKMNTEVEWGIKQIKADYRI